MKMPSRIRSWPVSRADALRRGLTRYKTGVRCQRGHRSLRITSTGACCQCMIEYRAKPAFRDKLRDYQRDYQKDRRAKLKAEAV